MAVRDRRNEFEERIGTTVKFCPACRTGLELRAVDGRERLCCGSAACNYVHWNNPVPVVAALVELDDKYPGCTQTGQWVSFHVYRLLPGVRRGPGRSCAKGSSGRPASWPPKCP
jgi:ribosomal protein S27AE